MRNNTIPDHLENQDLEFINEYMVQSLFYNSSAKELIVQDFPVTYEYPGLDDEEDYTCPVRDDFGRFNSSFMALCTYSYDDRKQRNSFTYLSATYSKLPDGSILMEGLLTLRCESFLEDTIEVRRVFHPEEFGIAA